MSPQERRDADRAKKQQQLQATQSKEKAENKKAEDTERLEFDKAKLAQRQKEFDAREKERKQVNKRMNKALKLKQSEAKRKRQNKKDASEAKKRAQLEKNVKTAQRAVDDRNDKMKKLKVGFDNVEKDDGLGTAFSKFGANIAQVADKTARGSANFAKREFPVIGQRAKLRRAKRELKDFENPPKKKPKVGSVTIDRSAAEKEKPKQTVQKIKTDQNVPGPQKLLPPARSQKLLPGSRGTYSKKGSGAGRVDVNVGSGGVRSKGGAMGKDGKKGKFLPIRGGAIAKKKTTSSALTDNQRAANRAQTTSSGDYASKADRIAAFKKRRAADKAAGVKMREEFLQEVEKMKKEKVDKVINVMRGKNKIETMPKVSESKDWRDDYKPLEFETVDLIKPEPLKPSDWRKDIEEASAAWTRKAGKKKSGGLNEKGRKSYERENPGSDLKAPSKKVGNPRRKSFCARMKGMKKKLTSSKTANDPDSRINKSLRAWNC